MTTTTAPTPDYTAIKAKQRAAWSSGDYTVVGNTLQIVGERLCEALDVRSGERLLDVAAGNGNVSLAAARRFCDVTSTDYVESLLQHGEKRARVENLPMKFEVADVEALQFADDSFDIVTSSFGVMFAPKQDQAAAEMLRVVRPGGRIGLANWTPDSFIGSLFKTLGRHIPPPAGLKSPALWGTRGRINEFFAAGSESIAVNEQTFVFRYESPEAWLSIWRSIYGPLQKAFVALDREAQGRLAADLIELIKSVNVATDGTMVVPAAYLEVVITKRSR